MSSDVSSFLNESDYEKHESFKFDVIGATIKGTIAEPPRLVEVDDLNNPGVKVKKLVVAIDNGTDVYAVWVGKGLLAQAISKAVKAAGAAEVAEGGTLAIRHTGVAEPTQRGFNGAKQYAAQYTAPAKGADIDDIFDD